MERCAQLLAYSELHDESTTEAKSSSAKQQQLLISESVLTLYRDEVQDAHRDFAVFQNLLERPRLLGEWSQIDCPVNDAAQRQKLIALFYGFDSKVLREFMGVQLTKSKTTLDDISDRTSVSIRSVRRQFENLRRVHSRFDEVSVFLGNTCEHICVEFCLSSPLARRYAAASFLLYHRFDLETSDRKYQSLSWGDCEYMAIQLMAKWTTRPVLMMSAKDRDSVDSIFGVATPSSSPSSSSSSSSLSSASAAKSDQTRTSLEVSSTPPMGSGSSGGKDAIESDRSPQSPSSSSKNRDVAAEEGAGGGRAIMFEVPVGEGEGRDSNNVVLPHVKMQRSSSAPISLSNMVRGGRVREGEEEEEEGDKFNVRREKKIEEEEEEEQEEEERDMAYGPSVSDVGFTASVDASGAQFSLVRRSSVDLAPAWLSDVRDMKTQILSVTDNVAEVRFSMDSLYFVSILY